MTAEEFDLEALLAPIAGDIPTGVDLRQDFSPASLYFRLRDARSEARAAERAADTDPTSDTAAVQHWRSVTTLARKALLEQTKDIEIAAWLTEALVRSDGIAGLAMGAALIDGLIDRYWEPLYPLPDEDGMETRVAPITGLNGEGGDGTLIQPLRKVKLFPLPDGTPMMFFAYEQSAELTTMTDKKRVEARIAAGTVPFDVVQKAGAAANKAALAGLRKSLREAGGFWRAMGEKLDNLAGSAAPPTSRVAELLGQIGKIVDLYGPPEAAAVAEIEAEAVPGDVQLPGGPAGGNGPRRLANREDALATLSELAEFFRKNEPQSPMAYTIDEAVRRARMSWPELLQEIITDEAARQNILLRLGIKPE